MPCVQLGAMQSEAVSEIGLQSGATALSGLVGLDALASTTSGVPGMRPHRLAGDSFA